MIGSSRSLVCLLMQIWECLDLDLLDGAEFHAQRLLAAEPGAKARHLYGIVMLRQRRYTSALHLTAKSLDHVGCCYIYAQCCLQLEKYTKGIEALESLKRDPAKDQRYRGMPDDAALHLLLGKLYAATKDPQAIKLLAASASENPWLWENVLLLCKERTVRIDVKGLFEPVSGPNLKGSLGSLGMNGPLNGPSMGSSLSSLNSHRLHSTPIPSRASQAPPETPPQPLFPAMAPTRRRLLKRGSPLDTSPMMGPPSTPQPSRGLFSPRESRRSVVAIVPAGAAPPAPLGGSLNGSAAGAGSNAGSGSGSGGQEIGSELCAVYTAIASIYQHFAAYECKEALALLAELPPSHRNAQDMTSVAARCYHELVDYGKAAAYYRKLRQEDPGRLEDMEQFSTALWFLKRDAELGFLAHELVDLDRRAWQPWVVMGNAYSRQQDPARALDCFERAIQIAPNCAYAHTLKGYEHVAEERLQSAQQAFRLAIRADDKHYNAWYGLSVVFLRSGDTAQAEHHLGQALRINPHNAILVCFLGTCLQKRGMLSQAIAHHTRACELQPACAVVRYEKVKALMNAQMYQAALNELQILDSVTPDEGDVHFLLGQTYRLLHNGPQAVKHFTHAATLDPKLQDLVKQEIEML